MVDDEAEAGTARQERRASTTRPTALRRAGSCSSATPAADLITEAIGEGWVKRLYRLSELRRFANDAVFQERWALAKRRNKG